MCDEDIIELYFRREEAAIARTREEYGRLIQSVAYNILRNAEEAEECENDVYLRAWDSIPPTRPERLCAYLCTISRRTALNRYKYNNAAKRGEALSTEELGDTIRSSLSAEDGLSESELSALLNRFLEKQDKTTRIIFMRRFWMSETVSETSAALHVSESMVKSRVSRTLKKLREFLSENGYDV
ncbi:MAG: sigma-70 family RNA polymerase sigma factor [Oscillospiraceae bacterium]|nr:sigma-70 family RNA polymerase sigma factor [Oscillospiraceae bacterium]